MNLGSFLNEYVSNSTAFWTLGVTVFFLLLIFGYFYNRLMDTLRGKEHPSLYVAIGVLVTIGAAALFSWKAGLLMVMLFLADGLPMIVGEFKRTHRLHEERKKNPRRKRIPYAANRSNNNPFDRQIREVIEKYRVTDLIISSSGADGYWLAATIQDIEELAEEYVNRSRKMEDKARELRRRGAEVFGPQMPLFEVN